jgi:glycolate oxidase iron-sulfur subunit
MLELARSWIARSGPRQGWARRFERVVLRRVVPQPRLLHGLVSALGMTQRVGLDRLARPLLPESLTIAHSLLPVIPRASARRALPEFTPAVGERRGVVAVFEGCVMPELFGAANRATVQVLAANGFDVIVPRGQGCCGALQAHAGDLEFARTLLGRNADAFGEVRADAVIVNSAGCGAFLRRAQLHLPGSRAVFAERVRDGCEFLDEVGLRPPPGRIRGRVCYDDPCHLLHGQGVEQAPRRLLQQIEGLELVEHSDPDRCCGAAGVYNLTHPEMARALLTEKLDALAAARPDIITSGNPGCLIQLRAGAELRGLAARVVHPLELLGEAYQ